MELKVKYQYTYFIKPFLIKENKYKSYIKYLLQNPKYKVIYYEKEKDLGLYSYFLPDTRNFLFPSFNYDKEKIKELENLKLDLRSTILSKNTATTFEYVLNKNIQGKLENEEGIYFDIENIKVICFNTGICFLAIKTIIENPKDFSQILDFNYKFKDINSKNSNLKDFDNIKIQTDKFSNIKELPQFIKEVTGINKGFSKVQDIDMYKDRFFTYTYACVEETNEQLLKNQFIKFTNVLSNNSNIEFKEEEILNKITGLNEFKNAKFGFTKQSASLLTLSTDINGYTKLLYEYETDYFYTLILNLYQRITLKKLELDFKKWKNINYIRNKFTSFTKEIWSKEATNSLTGNKADKKWKEVFELNNLYEAIKNKYTIIFNEYTLKKNRIINIILVAISAFLLYMLLSK